MTGATPVQLMVLPDADAVGRVAAEVVTELAARKPWATLGLATGATPVPLYDELARRVADGLDLSRLRAVALDEYVGLPADDPCSFRHYLEHRVVRPLGVHLDALDGCAPDLVRECERYECVLAAGVDLQLVGIGANGHLAFNEPASPLHSRTRMTTLSRDTRLANAAGFPGREVPSHVLTQGVGTILDARHLVLLATGARKAAALRAALEGRVSAAVPASALQRHARVTVVADEAAAAQLSSVDGHRRPADPHPVRHAL